MISKVKIKNFKCFFEEADIELSKISACVGMNSVGKSSLIQALLLMRKSYDAITKYKNAENEEYRISLNDGYALHLGSTDQIISAKDSDTILLALDDIIFKYRESEDKLSLRFKAPFQDKDLFPKISAFSRSFYYLNAERLGPRNYQQMESTDYLHCGYHGEFTFDLISKKLMEHVRDNRRFPYDASKVVPNLGKQVEYWLNYIVNGIEASFTSDLSTQLSQMKLQQTFFDTGLISPYNFGFGISYVLPIIATGLIAEPGTVMIVENPEAHLHPAGQSHIGQFLSQISRDHVQVIVETHSEHVINGIRIDSLKSLTAPEDVCINYFSVSEEEKRHVVKRVELNESMDILEWPDGFFDQEEKDLKELRILRRKRSEDTGIMG